MPASGARPVSLVAAVLAVATTAGLLAVDPRALAAFDAPKRLVVMTGIAAALVAAAFEVSPRIPVVWTPARKTALGAAAGGLSLAFLSAALSPHRAIAFDTLRMIAAFVAVVVLAVAHDRVWPAVAKAFVVGSTINAGISLLQIAGMDLFRYTTVGGRANTSAMIGNDGVLSLTMAFAAIIVAGWLASKELTRARRVAAAVVLIVLVTTMAANRSLTAIATLIAGGGAVLLLSRVRRNAAAAAAPLAMIVLVGLLTSTASLWPGLNRALTYRVGAWAAAAEMARERPLLGFGPGTYAHEFATHRIRADLRAGEWLANPFLAGSYAEAHSEYLQGIAEIGIPATLLLCAAVVACGALAGSGSAAGSAATAALLIAGAIAALTWFPLQHPAMAVLLLSALGQAWRAE